MKTFVKQFMCDTVAKLENEINKFCRERNLIPLSVSMVCPYSTIYAIVVVKKSEDKE